MNVIAKIYSPDKNSDGMRKCSVFIHILFLSIILFLSVRNISELNQIIIIDDEFGYWGIGAYFAGIDWSSTMATSGYYSYGYSMLLAPIILLIKDTALMYKAAIIMNALLLLLTYCVIYKINTALFKKTGFFVCAVAALTAVCYTNNLVQVNIAWSECLQVLLVSLIAYFVIKILQDTKKTYIYFFTVALCYLYAVHQRNIGILIVGILFLVFLLISKKAKWREILICFGIIAILFGVHTSIKGTIKTALWPQADVYNVNDYSGVKDKIAYLFTGEGISFFIIGILGRFFYLTIATGFLFLFFLVRACQRGYKFLSAFIRRKETDRKSICYFFILLMFLASLGVAVIFMTYPDMISTIMYGRYIETFVPVLLSLGILETISMASQSPKDLLTELFIMVVVTCTIGLFMDWYIIKMGITGVNFITVTGIFPYFKGDTFHLFAALQAAVMTAGVFFILLLLYKRNKLPICLAGAFFLLFFIRTADYTLKERVLYYQGQRDAERRILEYIPEQEKVYYVMPSESEYNRTKPREYLQYWMKDRKLHYLYKDEKMKEFDEDSCIVTSNKDFFTGEIYKEHDLALVYGEYIVWVPQSVQDQNKTDTVFFRPDVFSGDLSDKGKLTGEEKMVLDTGLWNYEEGTYLLEVAGVLDEAYGSQVLLCKIEDENGNSISEKLLSNAECSVEAVNLNTIFYCDTDMWVRIMIYAFPGVYGEVEQIGIRKQ